jgi:4-methyl-5(b-hydroxyethyl)-thiazole monophosphate biosynthesis
MSQVLVCLAPGFEEIEAITIIDLLRRAEIDVTIAGLEKGAITGSHNISVESDIFIDEIKSDQYDMVVLPGGQPGTNNLKASNKVLAIVKDFREKNKYIGAICAAPTVLAKAEILENTSVTSYPAEKSVFDKTDYKETNVVRDGKMITSRGVGTAIEFALELVEILKGVEVRKNLSEKILWYK